MKQDYFLLFINSNAVPTSLAALPTYLLLWWVFLQYASFVKYISSYITLLRHCITEFIKPVHQIYKSCFPTYNITSVGKSGMMWVIIDVSFSYIYLPEPNLDLDPILGFYLLRLCLLRPSLCLFV